MGIANKLVRRAIMQQQGRRPMAARPAAMPVMRTGMSIARPVQPAQPVMQPQPLQPQPVAQPQPAPGTSQLTQDMMSRIARRPMFR